MKTAEHTQQIAHTTSANTANAGLSANKIRKAIKDNTLTRGYHNYT